ncbi:MAG: hypothetical protein ACP5NU_04835 [Methanomicrobiales archaeon]
MIRVPFVDYCNHITRKEVKSIYDGKLGPPIHEKITLLEKADDRMVLIYSKKIKEQGVGILDYD